MTRTSDAAGLATLSALRTGRRALLTGAAAALTAAFTANTIPRAHAEVAPAPTQYPFTLGVASGDPLPDGVVLWTRIAPEPYQAYGGLDARARHVLWQVATDTAFRHVVRSGVALAESTYDHTVHVDVRGLRPWRDYYYRFRCGGHLSPVGRTRTAPAAGAHLRELHVAVTSCQNWGSGLYHAWEGVADDAPDLVIFLGDYIYEYEIVDKPYKPRPPELPSAFDRRTDTLERFRLQHAFYKSDASLQRVHRTSPFAVIWDDHDVVNDYFGDFHYGEPTDQFLVRRANAYRAFWEYLPLRRPQLPHGPDAQLYRRLRYGDLVTLNMLDDRQHWSPPLIPGAGVVPESPQRRDPRRSILGFPQEQWLYDGLDASTTTWNSLAQGVLFSQLDVAAGSDRAYSQGSWASCQAAMQRVIDRVSEREVSGFVVLTGDIHRNYDLNILADFDNPDSRVVGVEFAGTSISSGGDGHDTDASIQLRLAENPYMKFGNVQRGYLRCRIDHTTWRTDLRVLDTITAPDYTLSTRKTFITLPDHPGLQEA